MNEKLGELILYIASKSQGDPKFGATKLNKILFTVDFTAFANWGESVSNAKYIHKKHGPVASELPSVRDGLISEQRAMFQRATYYGRDQDRLIAVDAPDLKVFSGRELALIDDVIEDLLPLNATELSEWTHKLANWLVTVDGEEIPYFTVFGLVRKTVSREGQEWAIERLSELGLD